MPFSIRPFRHFPVQGSVTYLAGPFIKLPIASFFGFLVSVARPEILGSGD